MITFGTAPSGFRLPTSSHPGRVRLQVADLARSLAYYEGVLGLTVLQQQPLVATLGASGTGTPLVELHERAGAKPHPPHGRLGLYHYAVLLPDRASLGAFVRHVGERGERLGMADHDFSEAVYLTDPDGLGIEVYADRPRDQWHALGGQVVATTNPLNVADLLRRAAPAWNGAPSGTVVGHVHFHVGDLDEASRFYHTGLGFDRTIWSYPGALFVSAGGYHHHVGLNTWARGAGPADEEDARLLEWELVLPTDADIEAAAASLLANGYATTAIGASRLATDPWGITVRLASGDLAPGSSGG
jgi:catechol 2,3-dioxygenase